MPISMWWLLCEYVGPWKGSYGYWVGVKLDEADSGSTCTRMRRPNVGKYWGRSDCPAVALVAEGLCEGAAQWWAGCVTAALARERRCGSIAHPSSVAQHTDSDEDWVSCCNVLTSWRPGVNKRLHCRQSEPGSVAGSICTVQRCAPLRSVGNVYSLTVGDQLVPKQLLGMFLCTKGIYGMVATSLLLGNNSSLHVGIRSKMLASLAGVQRDITAPCTAKALETGYSTTVGRLWITLPTVPISHSATSMSSEPLSSTCLASNF